MSLKKGWSTLCDCEWLKKSLIGLMLYKDSVVPFKGPKTVEKQLEGTSDQALEVVREAIGAAYTCDLMCSN